MAVTVVAGLSAAGGAFAAAVAAQTAFTLGAFVTAFAIGAGLSLVSRALAPKPSLGNQLKGITQTSREPAGSRKLVYGKLRIGGQIVFICNSGTNNEYLHLVIVFASHEIESFEEFWFNDNQVYTNGAVTSNWSSLVTITKFDGTQTAADSTLTTASSKWTSNHVLNGMAYAHFKLKWDQDQFPQGVPNITAIIKGKKVYDPRDTNQSATDSSTWTYSTNPALCLRDYLVDSKYGLGEDRTLIDEDTLKATATVCDETQESGSDIYSTGAKRYELSGLLDTSNNIKDNIEQMLSAMGGRFTFSGGKYYVEAAEYRTPTITLDESVTISEIQVQTKQSRRGVYNGVKGIFVSEEKNYKVLDYPAQISSTYATEDGDPIYLDMPLPFVTSNLQAQLLAKLALLKSRQQTTLTMTVNLTGLKLKVGDTVMVTNTRLGYSSKVFEVVDYNLANSAGGEFGVQLTLIETASAIYDWSSSDEQDFLKGGELDLYDGRTVDNVTSLQHSVIGLKGPDGKLITSVDLTWTAPNDGFIEFYVVTYEKDSDGNVYEVQTRNPRVRLSELTIGSAYTFTVKAQNLIGVRSSGTTLNVASLAGDVTPPAVPTSPTTTGGIRQITVEWTEATDEDFALTLIYYNDTDNLSTATRSKTRGEEFVYTLADGETSPKTKYFWLSSIDYSGNESDKTASFTGTSVRTKENDIADGEVTTGKIENGAVTEVKIEDGAVTAGKITVNELSAISADVGSITAGTLQAGGSNAIPDANDSPSGSETGAFIDLDNGKFVFGDANKHLLYDGSTLLVKGELEADILDVIDATVTGQLTANAISAGAVTVASLSAGVFAEFDDRYGTSGGFYVTDTDEFFDGNSTKYVTVGTVAHSTDDIYFECRLNHSWSWPRNDTGDKLNANVSFEYSTDNSTWTTVPSSTTQVATATGVVAQYATLYSIAEDITYTMTGSALTAGNYYFRVKIVAQNSTNAFQLAAFGGGSGVPIAFEVQESSGISAAGGNADTLDNIDSTGFLRLGTSSSTIDNTAYGDQTFTGDVTIDGKLTVNTGTSSAPTYTFDGDTDTGIYRDVADTLRIATGGTARATFNSAGFGVTGAVTASTGFKVVTTTVIDSSRNITSIKSVELENNTPSVTTNKLYSVSGSLYWSGNELSTSNTFSTIENGTGDSSAPSYTFTGDTDTGMYADAANTLRFATGGSARATINSAGLGVTGTVGASAGFKLGLTQWMDSSRNLSSIGTISSGAITSTGNLTARTGTFSGQNGTALNVNSGTTNVAAKFESGDDEVWINLKDNNSGTYGALLGHADDALFKVADNSVNVRMLLSSAGLLDTDAGYSVSGTTVIDSSRNLKNIASASFEGNLDMNSYDITAVNMLVVDDEARLPSLKIGTTTVINSSRNLTNIGTGSFSGKVTISNANFANHLELVRGSDTLYLTPSGGQVVISGGLSPSANNTIDLGRSDKYWQDLWLGTSLKMGGTTVIDSSRNVTNVSTVTSTSVNSSNPSPSTDNAFFNGYGIIGNRGNFYITNSNSSGVVQIGVGGAHNANAKLSIDSTSITAEAGNIVVGNSSTASTVRTYWSDGAYTDLNGYGIQFARNASYLRPNNDNARTMYFGSSSNRWSQIQIHTPLLKMGSTQILNSSRILTNVTARLPDGGSTAPSFSFGSDTNTGFFRYGADVIGVTAGGTRRARFGSSIFLESNDVRINAYLYHNGDTDTHLRYETDRIIMKAGGVEMLDMVEGATDYVDIIDRVRVTGGGNLECEGNLIAYSTTSISDINQKENIQRIESPIEKIKQISGYTFDWKTSGEQSGGVIAQEIEQVMPSVVKETSIRDGDKIKAVDYQAVIGLLVETVKNLNKRIEELENGNHKDD